MKITLKYEQASYNEFSGKENGIEKTVVHEFEGVDLSTALENYEYFLRGIGFHFDGTIDLIENETVEPVQESQVKDMNYDFTELQKRWTATREPTTNTDLCSQCGLPETLMKLHKCWDPRCPIQQN